MSIKWHKKVKNMTDDKQRIYTLGTSTRSEEEFFDILILFGIKNIIDVRRYPRSKRFPYFEKETLSKSAKNRGFEYYWLGDKLGGFRKGGYKSYINSDGFNRGINELEQIGTLLPSVIICAERFPWKCHRRYISDSLTQRGWDVIHIIDEKRTWKPSSD